MASGTSWDEIAHEATQGLTADDGAKLEARIGSDPNDVDARVRLVGFYYLRTDSESQSVRANHLAWLAEHRPDVGLMGYGSIIEELAPVGFVSTRDAWRRVVTRADADVGMLENAAGFLRGAYPEEAETIYRRLAEKEPRRSGWLKKIARVLTLRARNAADDEERRRLATSAIAELTAALDLEEEDWSQLGLRIDLAKVATLAEDWSLARSVGERVLVDNETARRTFLYGNAIHHANITLGHAALAAGDVAGASDYLMRAARTPGSPQLDSFGPDWQLAAELLGRGAREVVLAYCDECARFWNHERAELAEWRAAIARGENPFEETDDEIEQDA